MAINLTKYHSGKNPNVFVNIDVDKTNPITYANIREISEFAGLFKLREPNSVLNDYRRVFKASLVDEVITPAYMYRPHAISERFYMTSDLWYLILFANDALHPMELNKLNIKIYPPDEIGKLLKIINAGKERLEYTRENPNQISDRTLIPLN
jgi:hypothetical protein